MSKLNDQQKLVVQHEKGPCMVVACPGSGKSHSLISRVKRLIQKGVQKQKIMCITFTNKAAKQMKQRMNHQFHIDTNGMYVGTFHAFCANVLRSGGSRVGYSGKISIIDQSDQQSFVKKIVKSLQYDIKQDKIDVDIIISIINNSRQNLKTQQQIIDSFKQQKQKEIVEKYFQQLTQNNLIDFTGLLYKTVQLLQQNDDIKKQMQSRFQYIQIDQVQDTSKCQFRIIDLLGETHGNIMCVGDPSQSLYSWRAARIQNIQQFKNRPNCVVIGLGKNYRSTTKIVKTADTLIKHNKSHMDVKFQANNIQNCSSVLCNECQHSDDQCEKLIKKIKHYTDNLGYDYKDITILYRMNKLSMQVQTSFARNKIPFKVIGGMNFFDRKQIKDAISMLRLAANPNDILSFHRIVQIFNGVGGKSLQQIEILAKQQHSGNLIKACRDMSKNHSRQSVRQACVIITNAYKHDFDSKPTGQSLDDLIKDLNYQDFLKRTQKNDGESFQRMQNINQLIINATEFDKFSNGLDKYLQTISLTSSSDEQQDSNSVTLMTGHASKGLQFQIVFVIGCEQDICPASRGFQSATTQKQAMDHLQQQTRIFYVMMTRAKRHLQTFYVKNRKVRKGKQVVFMSAIPSQFLVQSGLIQNQVRFNGKHRIRQLDKVCQVKQ